MDCIGFKLQFSVGGLQNKVVLFHILFLSGVCINSAGDSCIHLRFIEINEAWVIIPSMLFQENSWGLLTNK